MEADSEYISKSSRVCRVSHSVSQNKVGHSAARKAETILPLEYKYTYVHTYKRNDCMSAEISSELEKVAVIEIRRSSVVARLYNINTGFFPHLLSLFFYPIFCLAVLTRSHAVLKLVQGEGEEVN